MIIQNSGRPSWLSLTTVRHMEKKETFNVETGLWDFEGLNSHIPTDCESKAYIQCVIDMQDINSKTLQRNSEGYLEGVILKPKQIPDNCICGAGYKDETGEVNLVKQFKDLVTLYLSRFVDKCCVIPGEMSKW